MAHCNDNSAYSEWPFFEFSQQQDWLLKALAQRVVKSQVSLLSHTHTVERNLCPRKKLSNIHRQRPQPSDLWCPLHDYITANFPWSLFMLLNLPRRGRFILLNPKWRILFSQPQSHKEEQTNVERCCHIAAPWEQLGARGHLGSAQEMNWRFWTGTGNLLVV